MHVPEWLPVANFILNLIIIPLAKILWDIRGEMIRQNGRLSTAIERLERIEHRHDQIDINRARDQ